MTLPQIKHWIERVLIAPLFQRFCRSNSPIAPLSILAERFEQTLTRPAEVTDINAPWGLFSQNIREEARRGDIAYFLHWPTIRKTMFSGDEPHVREAARRLKSSRDWNHRWKPALREDAFGGPVPSRFYWRSSPTLVHHANHIATFESVTEQRVEQFDVIVEFGGGYGSMCRLVRRLGFEGTYVIFDLPPLSAIQQLFLEGAGWRTETLSVTAPIDPGRNYLTSEVGTISSWVDFSSSAGSKPKTLFIATWSLSEAPIALRRVFVERMKNWSAVLVAYQQFFDGIDNQRYFSDMACGLSGWHFHDVPVSGMAAAAGRYCIGVNTAAVNSLGAGQRQKKT